MPRRALPLAIAIGAAVLGVASAGHASDHIDGVKTSLDVAADITDVFTFTSPEDASKLVLAMNVHGLAYSGSRFSDAVDYKLRVRPIEDATTLAPSRDAGKEAGVTCTFDGGLPIVASNQHVTCVAKLADGTETVQFDTRGDGFRAGGSGEKNGVRIFAGVRSDPWFLDLAKVLKWNAGLPVLKTPGLNGLFGQNVLSIVVEIDKKRLPGSLLAVNAQTVRK